MMIARFEIHIGNQSRLFQGRLQFQEFPNLEFENHVIIAGLLAPSAQRLGDAILPTELAIVL